MVAPTWINLDRNKKIAKRATDAVSKTDPLKTPTRSTVLQGTKEPSAPKVELPRLDQLSQSIELPAQPPVVQQSAQQPQQFQPEPTQQFAQPQLNLNDPAQLEAFLNKRTQSAIQPTLDIYGQAGEQYQNLYGDYISNLEKQKAEAGKPLMEMGELQKDVLGSQFDQAIDTNRINTDRAVEDTARRFGMSGFGRSTIHTEAQTDLQRQQAAFENELTRSKLLENARIDAEIRGATQDQLNVLDNQILDSRSKLLGVRSGLAQNEAELRLKALESGEASLQSIIEEQNRAVEAQQKNELEKNKAISESFKYLMDTTGSGFITNASPEELQYYAESMGIPVQSLQNMGKTMQELKMAQEQGRWEAEFEYGAAKDQFDYQFKQQQAEAEMAFKVLMDDKQFRQDLEKMGIEFEYDQAKAYLGEQFKSEKAQQRYANLSYGDLTSTPTGGNGNYFEFQGGTKHPATGAEVVMMNNKLVGAYPPGYKKSPGKSGLGGQCAFEAQKWTVLEDGKGWTIGSPLGEKKKRLAAYRNQGKAYYPGEEEYKVGQTLITSRSPVWGHAAVINAIKPDGTLVLSEFNKDGKLKFSNNREIPPNAPGILGVVKTVPNSKYKVNAGEIKKVAEQTARAGLESQGGIMSILGKAILGGNASQSALQGVSGAIAGALQRAGTKDTIGQAGMSTGQAVPSVFGKALGGFGGLGALGAGISGALTGPSRADLVQQESQIDPQRQRIRSGQATQQEIDGMIDQLNTAINDPDNPNSAVHRQMLNQLYEDLSVAQRNAPIATRQLSEKGVMDLSDMDTLEANLSQLGDYVNSNIGMFDPTLGTLRSWNPGKGYDEQLMKFDGLKTALTGPTARKVLMEVGALTDTDLSRVAEVLPQATDSSLVAQFKINQLMQKIQEAKQKKLSYLQKAGFDTSFASGPSAGAFGYTGSGGQVSTPEYSMPEFGGQSVNTIPTYNYDI